ncbi:MAG: MmcQ/YjbR family DNA-binding protein [Balneolaceae bacterium]|nr:MmcQ/YjbR family DNA-binding protein [Balneolaceae bacterium]
MDIITFREFCLAMPAVTEGMPFGEDVLVFKVKGKIFCLTNIDTFEFINVKCDPGKALLLREEHSAVKPGYHMNKKHWNSVYIDGSISDKLIREWIVDSYNLVVGTLPEKTRQELRNE